MQTSGAVKGQARVRPPEGGDPGAVAILGEIVRVQHEYLRDGDPGDMWQQLLDSLLRTTDSAYGFIAEVGWTRQGMPELTTRAMVWLEDSGRPVAPHPDIGLLVSKVIAEQGPVLLDLAEPARADATSFAPISGFLGLPLISSDRLVGVVALTSPVTPYRQAWVDSLQPLLSTCASIVEAIQSSRDRDRAVEELEQTASFLQALVNGTSHAVIVVDRNGTVRSSNPAAARLTGLPEGRLVGRSVLDFVAARDRRRVSAAVRRFTSKGVPAGTPPVTVRVLGAGGTVPVEASVGEMVLDGERRLVVLCQDVTDRLAAQSALARAGEILEATPDLITWARRDGGILYLNRGGRSMLGLVDDPPGELQLGSLWAGDSATRFAEVALPAALDSGSWTGELAVRAGDATEVPVSVVVISASTYTAVLARDLTERYEVERLKEGFVSNVSHELRTPLTAVIGYLELLGEGSLGGLTPEQEEAVDIMQRNGERLLELIAEILLVGSFDSERPPHRREIDLSAVVADAVEEHRTAARRGRVEVASRIEPGIALLGDDAELRAAISNLVGNAIKFTLPGGEVDVSLRREESIVFEVADSGIGIPAADLQRVFDRFYRGEHARAAQIQGTGLGLSIVSDSVQRHGGTVEATSTVGEGTVFRVEFPDHGNGMREGAKG